MGLFLMVGITNSTFAQFSTWNNPGSTNSFGYVEGWNQGQITNAIPNNIDAYLFNGGITVSAGESFTPNQLILGWEDGHIGTFTQSGGDVRTALFTRVGAAGTQTFNQSGGTYSASDLMVGWRNGA
ncbi:MAG: hypothetical protein EB006_13160, partial [Betaproteobacteria bacterium]|nr:hypothetical protein [Betaproteobacteria bacterium]